jgi:hypothetical protein
MQVTIDLTPEQVEQLERAFIPSRFETSQDLIEALLPMMAATWLDWITAAKRYNSLTEQYTDWLEQIYAHLLPVDEAPTAERMFNSFNLPYGQAQYIARVLNNRAQAHWRAYALEQLKAKLSARKAEAEQWVKEKRAQDTLELMLFRPSFQELEIFVESLFRKNPDEIDILRVNSTRNLYAVRITARTFLKICRALKI